MPSISPQILSANFLTTRAPIYLKNILLITFEDYSVELQGFSLSFSEKLLHFSNILHSSVIVFFKNVSASFQKKIDWWIITMLPFSSNQKAFAPSCKNIFSSNIRKNCFHSRFLRLAYPKTSIAIFFIMSHLRKSYNPL